MGGTCAPRPTTAAPCSWGRSWAPRDPGHQLRAADPRQLRVAPHRGHEVGPKFDRSFEGFERLPAVLRPSGAKEPAEVHESPRVGGIDLQTATLGRDRRL